MPRKSSASWHAADVTTAGFNARLLGAAAAAAGFSLAATARGPGLSPDSVSYLAAGINLANGRGLTLPVGDALTIFPPGLPFVAALGEWTGLSAQLAVRLLMAVAAAAIVLLSHSLLRRMGVRGTLLWGATALLALSPVVLDVSKMAWTEAPFIALALWALLLAGDTWLRPSKRVVDLLLLALPCWGAFMFRYAAVGLIAALALCVFVMHAPAWKRAAVHTAIFVGFAVAVPAIWLLRNWATDGTVMGGRGGSPDTLGGVLRGMLETIGQWVLPLDGPSDSMLLALGLAAVVALILLAGSAFRWPSSDGAPHAHVLVLLLFVIVYVPYLAAAQLSTVLDPIGTRLLSPIYVPLLLLAAAGVPPLVRRLDNPNVRRVALVVGVLFLVGQATTSARAVRAGVVSGIGFNARSWTESELAAATAAAGSERAVAVYYSNQTWGLWAAAQVQPLVKSPSSRDFRGTSQQDPLAALRQRVECSSGTILLAWFDQAAGPDDITPDALSAEVRLDVLAVAADGTLYALAPLNSVDTAIPCLAGTGG